MKTIDEIVNEYATTYDAYNETEYDISRHGFIAGVEFAQQWISVEEELPNEENGYFDKQVLVKRFNDFERTEIEYKVTKYNKRGWEEYSRIISWRPIEIQ
jgi:hypothetical protein